MEVVPQNVLVRFLVVIVLLVVFVLSGAVVSSFTSSIARLDIARRTVEALAGPEAVPRGPQDIGAEGDSRAAQRAVRLNQRK